LSIFGTLALAAVSYIGIQKVNDDREAWDATTVKTSDFTVFMEFSDMQQDLFLETAK
jgi:hypothetical protein